jgi:hypothetical protein
MARRVADEGSRESPASSASCRSIRVGRPQDVPGAVVRMPGKMQVNRQLSRLVWWALAASAVVALCAGCAGTPHKQIEAIGVVAAVSGSRSGGDIIDTYTFDDGRTYSMHFRGDRNLEGPGVLPNVGHLLIAGSKPDFWLLVARPFASPGYPTGCFGLGGAAGYDTETTVELDFGVTLQKAPGFNPTGHGTLGRFGDRGVICLDRHGRVTQINA